MRCQPFRGKIHHEALSPSQESSGMKKFANNSIEEDDDDCWLSKDFGNKRQKMDSTNNHSHSFYNEKLFSPLKNFLVEQPKRIEKIPKEVIFLEDDDNEDKINYEGKNEDNKSNNDNDEVISNTATEPTDIGHDVDWIKNEEHTAHIFDNFIKNKNVDTQVRGGQEEHEEIEEDDGWLCKDTHNLSQKTKTSEYFTVIEKPMLPLKNFKEKSHPVEQTIDKSSVLNASTTNYDNNESNADDDTSTEPGEIPPSDSETEPGELPPSDVSMGTEPGEIPLSDLDEENDELTEKEKNDEMNNALLDASNTQDSWLVGKDERGRRFTDAVVVIRMGIL